MTMGFPGGDSGKEPTCQCRRCKEETRVRSLGSEDPLEGGQDNPLQYSCLENPKDRGAWQATVHSVTESQTQRKQLSIREIANENLLNSTGVGGEEGTIYL